MDGRVIRGVCGFVIGFSLACLLVLAARADLPPSGLAAAAAISATLLVLAGRMRADIARSARSPAAIGAGLLLGFLTPAPTPPQGPRRAPDPFASGSVVACRGVVAADGRQDDSGAAFRLESGPMVRVGGAHFTPLPGTELIATGRLDASGEHLACESPEALQFVRAPPPLSPRTLAARVRVHCRDQIRAACDPETAGFLLALLIGDAGLPIEARDEFARTGTLHLIAVSGTHLSLFLAGLRIFTRRLRIVVPLLTGYAVVCGLAPPVLRSLVLAIGHLAGRRSERVADNLGFLLFSGVVVLVFDPTALHDAGFQLSFAAYAGLLCVAHPSHEKDDPFATARRRGGLHRVRDFIAPELHAGIGATLLTSPVTVWRFHRFSPLGVPATLLLSPFIPALLWVAVIIVVFPEFRPAALLARCGVHTVLWFTDLVASLPGASIDLARPHVLGLAVSIVGAIVLALRGPALSLASRVIIGGLSLLAVCVPDRAAPGFYQLDAGRGAATLLVAPRAAVLMDVGPRGARVADQILTLGVRHLDELILSHAHDDHLGAIGEIRDRLGIGDVVVTHAVQSKLAHVLPSLRTRLVQRGERVTLGRNELLVLHPDPADDLPGNDGSLVVRADWEGARILLPADLEVEGMRALLKREWIGPIDGLLVPHHGSANDALGELLARTRPRWAVIAARPGFAAEETRDLLEWSGCTVRSTTAEGVVRIPLY